MAGLVDHAQHAARPLAVKFPGCGRRADHVKPPLHDDAWNTLQIICRPDEAGATVMPASPGFYSRPETIEDVADTVVARILDQLGLPNPGAFRWQERE